MLEKIVSGSQTGVDTAAIIAAELLGLKTGGWAPHGWHDETGTNEAWMRSVGMKECPINGYVARTEMNVRDSDATLIISHELKLTGGTYDTQCVCESLGKLWYQVYMTPNSRLFILKSGSKVGLKEWLYLMDVKILNCAGPRRSKCPWLEEAACRWLVEALSA